MDDFCGKETEEQKIPKCGLCGEEIKDGVCPKCKAPEGIKDMKIEDLVERKGGGKKCPKNGTVRIFPF